MKLADFIEVLRSCADAHNLSVFSEGGYWYLATDRDGRIVSPSELGISLELESGDYVRVESDVYSRTAKITPSVSVSDNANVSSVGLTEDGHACVVEGDIW